MDVLADLVSRRGAVVSREELERDVWRGALVCKDALTKTLIKLRKALGDDRHEPASMRTVPKPGYRLAAAVDRSAPPEGRASFVESRPIKRHHRSLSLMVAGIVVGVIAAGVLLLQRAGSPPTASPGTAADSAPEIESATGAPPTVAVLTFEVLGEDPEQIDLARGLTADLSRFSGLSLTDTVTRVDPSGNDAPAVLARIFHAMACL